MSNERIRLGVVEDSRGERLVLVLDAGACPLEDVLEEPPADMQSLIVNWDRYEPALSALVRRPPAAPELLTLSTLSWQPPVRPRKLLCVGSNYHDHVAEMDGPAGLISRPSPFPYSFLKPATALVGSAHEVTHPSYGSKLDWEAELAVVIGNADAASGPRPMDAVFGYTILNDLSLRDFIPFPHALGLDAIVSKGFDGAAPMGPWITCAHDALDPQTLSIELRINGELMQSSSTSKMIFSVEELLEHYARVLTLEPGDVIATGTPAGVGAARRPPRYLLAGDRVEATIGDLGRLETTIGAAAAEATLMATMEVNA